MREAAKICADYNQRVKDLVPTGSLASQAETAHQVNLLGLAELAKLRALTPPDADANRLAGIYNAFERALRTADASTVEIMHGQVQQATSDARTGAAILAQVNQQMASFGMTVCAH